VKLKRRRRGRKCKPLPRAKDRRRQAAAVVVGEVVDLDIDTNVDNPTRSRALRGFFRLFSARLAGECLAFLLTSQRFFGFYFLINY
jgi:hypothetical protein